MSIYEKPRHFLHPVSPSSGKPKLKHYRIQTEGTTRDGTRLRQIESQANHIRPEYRNAIIVEPLNGPPMMVYGSQQEIHNVAQEIKTDPNRVMRKVRPVGASAVNTFYLGTPPPHGSVHADLSPKELSDAAAAQKMFPTQGQEQWPRDRMQEEKQAFKQHQRELATKQVGGVYPSSADGQAAVEQALAPAAPAETKTLVT